MASLPPRQGPAATLHADARRNAAFWDGQADDYQRTVGAALARHPRCWGAFFVPDDELGALGSVDGRDVLELGCGGARWSVELAAMGARCTGLDVSQRQLDHAARHAAAAGQTLTLVHAAASAVPLPDESFDLVFCDHGGLTYDDPHRVLPECARLLRPGGRLVFNTTSPWAQCCLQPDGETVAPTLARDYFALGRCEDADGVTWVLGAPDWIRLLTASGFTVDSAQALRPAPDAPRVGPRHWARRWPAEELWCTTKR